MIRFIILAIVAYVFYRALKSWMFPASDSSKSVSSRNADQLDDVMIKDPFCEAYFPKRNAVHLKFDGEDLYFCSIACKEQYIATQSGNEEKSG
jgi:YHS domain-containing protein